LPHASSVSQPFFSFEPKVSVGAVVVLKQCKRCQCNELCNIIYMLLLIISWVLLHDGFFCYLNALCRSITDLVLILIDTCNASLCFNKLSVALMLPYNDEFCCCLLTDASALDMDFYY
jgi:hypothetical protein